jgi:galactitol PTS system EIIA component
MEIVVTDELILLDLEGNSKEALLGSIADNLCAHGFVKSTYKEAILAREKVFPTGLPTQPFGVAIPHTDIVHVEKPAVSMARFKKAVEFVIMGEESKTIPVKIAFMLAMKEEHAQLDMLQKLMAVLQDREALRFLEQEKDERVINKFMQEKLGLKG